MVAKSHGWPEYRLKEQPLDRSHGVQQSKTMLRSQRLKYPRDLDALTHLQFAELAASFNRECQVDLSAVI